METGDFCNANRRCVMPSTPGDPESTCPNQAVRTIRRRKVEKRKKAKAKHRRKKGNRLVGASAQHTDVNLQLRYPWICSLKTRGFRWLPKVDNRLTFILRGRHLCSLTLLSAPPRKTILVGPAHCNFLCKDDSTNVVEVCCCRSLELANSGQLLQRGRVTRNIPRIKYYLVRQAHIVEQIQEWSLQSQRIFRWGTRLIWNDTLFRWFVEQGALQRCQSS